MVKVDGSHRANTERARRRITTLQEQLRQTRAELGDANTLLKARTREWALAAHGAGTQEAGAIPWASLRCDRETGEWYALAGATIHEACRELPLLAGVLGETMAITFNGVEIAATAASLPRQLHEEWAARREGSDDR